jgi:hypothetical protein
MIRRYREYYNKNFTAERYLRFKDAVANGYPPIPIRFAETPVFIPSTLKEQLISAGGEIIKVIRQPNFKSLTDAAIPKEWMVPGENDHPHFLALDFGICRDEDGQLVPRLIEMQGFPSLFGLQPRLADQYKDVFELDQVGDLTPYFNGLSEEQYFDLLKRAVIAGHNPEEVALMDINAPQQKTAIDFYITQKHLGIAVLSLTDIFKEGKQLFYWKNGRKIRLKRIYNRLIFDEIQNQQQLFKHSFDPREPLEIEWVAHPNWFYRISKFTLPFLKNVFVPETRFLNTIVVVPEDLENYVLKPLFSFAGTGVIIDVTAADIQAIADPENWILQKKVVYEPVVQSPDGLVKTEIRLLYIWPDGEEPQLCINLARLSRGKMIGVNHNADLDWVGGTVGLMDI